ncbi:lipoprotein [Clostridioides difficile]|uniref:germination lipoprotein GerS n=1 Tax=Clostridioides difficile TaxID=1496 RepID=UPI000D1DE345|nr:germination lipoprotein GerS [Clostridioides difficile]UWD41124.1 hypothetical protein NYF05_18010 [Clostridioides difficile]UWD44907.1 hypothetical protein NYU56_17775 [Clostridioides difficile]VFF93263.1 lipoprotein [Clostridioides difficile]VIF85099.1 lipoprotein [Clostridioides difficile]HBE9437877.1 hypothetical protein [Clostridioides difficile]
MRKKWTIVCIMFLALVIIVIGCQKRQSTKEEVYKDFQKQISEMNYYSCKAEVEVVGNKSPHNYVLIHTYKKTDNYKLEVISPKHLKGKSIEYQGDKILVKNPKISDIVELPNTGKNNQYLFIGDFIKNYLQNEEMKVKLSKGHLVLETFIPGDNKYFNKQVLYVNADTKNPEKMEVLDKEGVPRFTVKYKDFEYRN